VATAVAPALLGGLTLGVLIVPPASAGPSPATLTDNTNGNNTSAMAAGDSLHTTWSFSPTGDTVSAHYCSTPTPATDAVGFAAACPNEAFAAPATTDGSLGSVFAFEPGQHGQPCAIGTACDLVFVDSVGDVAPFNIEASLSVGAANETPTVDASPKTNLHPGDPINVTWSGFDLLAGSTKVEGFFCNTATPGVTPTGPSSTDCPGGTEFIASPASSSGSVNGQHVPSPATPPCVAGATCWMAVFDEIGGGTIQFDASVPLTMASASNAFNVNTNNDVVTGGQVCALAEAGCSLREAVIEADAATGAVTINVPNNLANDEFHLAIAPSGSADDPATGDLDITGSANVTINGISSPSPTPPLIDGGNLDRIFAVDPGASLTLSNLVLTDGTAETAHHYWNGDASSPAYDDTHSGGAILNGGTLVANGLQIMQNTADTDGGAVAAISPSGSTTVAGSSITNNTAPAGAAASREAPGPVTLTTDTVESNNGGPPPSGAIEDQFDNQSDTPDAVPDMTITGTTVSGNGGVGYVSLQASTVTGVPANGRVQEDTFSTNSNGGIGFTGGNLTVRQSLIAANQSTSTDFGGIGIDNATATIDQTTIFQNYTSGSGGGLKVTGSATGTSPIVTVTNSSILDNTAQFFGGGIYALQGGAVSLEYVTMDGNIAATGPDLYVDTTSGAPSASVTMADSILGGPGGGQVGELNPMASFSPNASVADGTTVSVLGTAFNSGEQILVTECSNDPSLAQTSACTQLPGGQQLPPLTASGGGNIDTTFVVHTGQLANADPAAVCPGTYGCSIVVGEYTVGAKFAAIPINFPGESASRELLANPAPIASGSPVCAQGGSGTPFQQGAEGHNFDYDASCLSSGPGAGVGNILDTTRSATGNGVTTVIEPPLSSNIPGESAIGAIPDNDITSCGTTVVVDEIGTTRPAAGGAVGCDAGAIDIVASALPGSQNLISETFSHPGTALPVTNPSASSAFPCLTAGADPNATPIAGCALSPPDADGSGVLRLDSGSNASGIVLPSVPTANGLAITFKQYQYSDGNSPDGDGINFFMAVAKPYPSILGGAGGAIGYTPDVGGGGAQGMPGGYLGIGFDLYGNYSSTSYDGTGCSDNFGGTANTVAVRGPGDGDAGYCLLSESNNLPFNLLGTQRSDAARSVRVIIDTNAKTYTVSIDPTGGTNYQQVTSGALPNYSYDPDTFSTVPGIPARLALGFAGSNGAASDFHEISDVNVSTLSGSAPLLGLDQSDSTYGQINAGSSSYPAGQTFYYVLGPSVAPGPDETSASSLVLSDTLPADETLLGAGGDPTQWNCAASTGNTVSCAYVGGPTVTGGSPLGAVFVQVRLSNTAPSGPIVNTASLVSDDAAQPAMSSYTLTVIGSGPTLALTKTDSVSGAATAGEDFTYTLAPSVATGADETQASSLVVTDPLPPGVTVNGTVQDGGANNEWDCTASTATNVSCAWVGGSTVTQSTVLDTITVPVMVDPQAPTGAVLNTASIASSDATTVTANDTVNVTASQAPQLIVTGPGGSTVPAGGDVIPFDSLNTEALINTAPLHSSPLHSSPLHSSPLHSSTLLSSILYSSPLHSSPLHSSPLHSSPLHSSPLHSSPLHSSMLYSEQLAGAPLHSSPLHSSPLHSSTLAPISLSTIPLHSSADPALTWADVLAGTPFAGKPLQDVTLLDVLNYDEVTPIPLFDTLSMADVDFSSTPLAHVGLAAFLLAQVPLHYLAAPTGQVDGGGNPLTGDAAWCQYLSTQPVNCSTPGWDSQAVTLLTLELAQDDLSAYYSSPISLLPPATELSGTTDLPIVDSTDTPTGAGDLTFSATIADFPLSGFDIGATPLNGFAVTTEHTVGDLINDVANGKVTGVTSLSLQDLIPGLVSDASQFDYTGAPFDELLAASPVRSTNLATYQLSFNQDCASATGLTANVNLPAEFRYAPGTSTLNVNGAGANPIGDPTVLGQDVRFSGLSLGAACPSATPVPVVISFGAEPSGLLGPSPATASIATTSQQSAPSNPAPITVIDGQGTTNPASPTPLTTDALYTGYLTTAGQPEYWTFPAPPPGTRVNVTLSSLPADYDLVAYGPAGVNPSVALRASSTQTTPSISSPIPDNTPQIAGTSLAPPQTLQDVPLLGNLPVLTYSTDRGTTPESLTVTGQVGVTGNIVIQVSGFNGATSTQPYVLRAETIAGPTALPCQNQPFPFAGQGSTTDSLPATPLNSSTETLILVNEKRMGDLYGSQSTSLMLTKLHNFAAQPNVKGVIVPVEANPAVAAAYSTWDSNSCSVAGADHVVRAINDLVDTLRPGLTNLRFIDIIGSDAAIPQARLQDLASISNEQDYADQDRFDGFDNAISSAQLDGYMLSDDPYGSFSPKPFLGSELYPPDVALGRIVESSDQVSNALDQYDNNSNGGQLDPTSAAVSGYDFMTNGATQIASNLNLPPPPLSPVESLLIGPLWTGSSAISAIAAVGAAKGYASINGHYNNYQGEPADMFYGAPVPDVFTAAQLQAQVPSLAGSLLFTMGCHAGLNLPDVMVSSPGQADSTVLTDWAQTVTGLGGLYDANTGFGYGDNLVLAYSEKLMSYYAANLAAGTMSVAQAMQFAKDRYVGEAGAFGAYDDKAVAEATFYGIPNYTIGTGGIATPPAPPAPTPGLASSPITVHPTFTTIPTSPAYQEAIDPSTGQPQPPQVMNLRPTEPKLALDETPTDGRSLHGFYITSLASTDNGPGVPIPPIDAPTIDSANETAPNFTGVFPSSLQGVSSSNTPTGQKQYLALILGQLFVDPTVNNGTPTERNFTHVSGNLYRSDSPDFTPPTFDSADAVVTGSSVTFTATTSSPNVTNANVMYRDDLDPTWQELDLSGNGSTFSATVGLRPGATRITEFFAQLLDGHGNVGVTSDKGFGYQSTPVPPPPAAPGLGASFTPSSVLPGGTTTLALSLSNPNSTALDGTAVATTLLPSGVALASPTNLTNTCGGTASATAGGISLSGGTIGGNASCTITVDVVAPGTPGPVPLATGLPSATGTPAGVAAASILTVVALPAVVLAPTTLGGATVGAPFSQVVTATGAAPIVFGSSGSLDGLSVGSTACPAGTPATIVGCALISGSPTSPGPFSLMVTATDANNTTSSQSYNLVVNGVAPGITGTPPGAGVTPLVVNQTITPFSFNVSGAPAPTLQLGGVLPPGLTFVGGLLSGTPTAAGKFAGSVSASNGVTDANGVAIVATDTFTIVVNGPLSQVIGVPPSTATVGVAYPFQFSASGTPAATSFSVVTPGTLPPGATAGLPPGLTLDNTGAIGGTPTTAGIYAAQVSASNGIAPAPVSAVFTITVKPSGITITAPTLTPGTVGTAYGPFTYTASVSVSSWSVTALAPQPAGTKAGLPPGLSISSGGVLSGTPTSDPTGPHTYAGNITAADSFSDTASAPFSITVNGPLTSISGPLTDTATVGTSYTHLFTTTGNPTANSFAVVALGTQPPGTKAGLPPGLTLDNTGLISGTPTADATAPYTYAGTITATNAYGNSQSTTFTITVSGPATINPPTTDTATVGTGYSHQFAVTGYPVTSWSAAPTSPVPNGTKAGLPPGLSLSSGGLLSGTPTTDPSGPYVYSETITATNGYGAVSSPFTITVAGPLLTINGPPPSTALVGVSYGPFQYTTTGYSPATTFTVTTLAVQPGGTTSGLPPGLSVNNSGLLGGTSLASDSGTTYAGNVTANNGHGAVSSPFSIVVDAPPTTVTGTPPNGLVNTVYPAFNFVANGYPAPTFAMTTGTLPAGLSLNSTTGAISGTPTVAGLTTGLIVTATNTKGTKTLTFSIEIDAPPTTVTGTPPAGVVGTPYPAFHFTANGYPAPTFAMTTGTLPAGLSLASATGVISGTPTVAGLTTGLIVTATNTKGTKTLTFSIEIDAPPTIVSGAPPAGTVGTAYPAFHFTANGYPAPTFAMTTGTLPAGLSLASATGVISGTPTVAGLTTGLIVTATNTRGSAALTFSIEIDGPPTALTGTPPAGVVGTPYPAFHFTANGYPAPTFAISTGTLPPGLSLNATTGAISGTPTKAATTSGLVVKATNSKGSTTLTFSIVITGGPVFTADSPPATGTLGTAYTYMFAATGTPAPTFAVSSGTLPPGLTLSSAGKLTGAPTDAGVFKFVVSATNTGGSTLSPTLTITVAGGKDFVSVKITNANQSTAYSNGGFITSGNFSVTKNVSPPGPAVSSTGQPTIAGTNHGSAKVTITNVWVPLLQRWVEDVSITDGNFQDTLVGASATDTVTSPTPNSATATLKFNGQTVTWTVDDNG
jgi:hypothetical protein